MLQRYHSAPRDPGRFAWCPRCVLVGPAPGGVHTRHAPVDLPAGIGIRQDRPENPLPDAVRRPAAVAFVQGLAIA